jgi:cytochrome c-type biogenesis protein CcmF
VIPEIGQFALILALCVALIQTVLPIVGAHIGKRSWVAVAVPATRVQLLFVGIAFAILTYSFITTSRCVTSRCTPTRSCR